MINLITGAPGSGKTCWLIGRLLQELKTGRPFFTHGIPELTLPHEELKCDSPNCKHCSQLPEGTMLATEAHKQLPEGAIIILDEAQHIYRPRSAGSKVPNHVQWLETHRHDGFDLYVLTQSPTFVDKNLRECVTTHIHLMNSAFGRRKYEWPECNTNTQSNRSGAVSGPYKLNKKVFELYKSSSLHVKQKFSLPKIAYALPFLILLFIGGVYQITGKWRNNDNEETAGTVETSTGTAFSAFQSIPNENVDLYKPVDPYRLESAPIYKPLVTAKSFPRVAMCLSKANFCQCYTQQGTIYPTTFLQCLDHLDNKVFDPYLADEVRSAQN